MTPVELVLSKLPGAKRDGQGWQARCPAHDDRQPSLSIAQGDDGRALLRCHAGCTAEAVAAALGLRMAELMPAPAVSTVRKPVRKTPAQRAYATAADAVAELERQHGRAAARWVYQNAACEPVGVVVRWNSPTGKTIRPVSRTAGGWIVGGMPEPRPLYRLPELLARPAERVYVCEGEKAADAAASVGLLATTSPHGSKSATKADWQPLAGRDVVILPDNDDPGRQYARAVAGILAGLSRPATVRVVNLPELPDGGDFVEYLDTRDGAEPETIRAEVEALADNATPARVDSSPASGPVLVCLADVEPREVRWLWPGRIPLGRISLLVGRPGEGKSFVTTDMAARVTTGTPWPDGSSCPSGSVILISAEDDPADTIRPRLDAHLADVSRVHLLSAVRRVDEDGQPCEVMFTLDDVRALEVALQARSDCKLIVVDPIGSFLGGRTDAHRDNEVRAVLAPVAMLAEKYGAAVLVVAHRRKSAGSIADDLALGSRAFTGIARAVWHLTRDGEDKGRRLLLPGKNNLAPEGTGLAFRIIGEPAAIAWEADPVAMSADDALAVENGAGRDEKPGPEPEARNAAADWLRKTLANGPRPAKGVTEEALEGQGITSATLRRAREAVGVAAYRPAVPGPWWWRLPNQDAHADPKDGKPEHLEHLAENTGLLPAFAKNTPRCSSHDSLSTLGSKSHPEPHADRPPPEGIPAGVWAKIQARKAAGRPAVIPEGWTRKTWARELRRMADVCAVNNPDQAVEYRRQADELEKAA